MACLQSRGRRTPWWFCAVLLGEACYCVGSNPAKPGSCYGMESVRRSGETQFRGAIPSLQPALLLSLLLDLSSDCPIQSSWMEKIWTTLWDFTRILKRHPLSFPSSVHVSPWIRSLAFQKLPLFTHQDTVSPTQLPEHFVAFLEHLLPPTLPCIVFCVYLLWLPYDHSWSKELGFLFLSFCSGQC